MPAWFLNDPPLTKRQLGWLLTILGMAGALVILGIDVLGAGRFTGIGPAQLQALGLAGLVSLLGLSLVPLGNRLA